MSGLYNQLRLRWRSSAGNYVALVVALSEQGADIGFRAYIIRCNVVIIRQEKITLGKKRQVDFHFKHCSHYSFFFLSVFHLFRSRIVTLYYIYIYRNIRRNFAPGLIFHFS